MFVFFSAHNRNRETTPIHVLPTHRIWVSLNISGAGANNRQACARRLRVLRHFLQCKKDNFLKPSTCGYHRSESKIINYNILAKVLLAIVQVCAATFCAVNQSAHGNFQQEARRVHDFNKSQCPFFIAIIFAKRFKPLKV